MNRLNRSAGACVRTVRQGAVSAVACCSLAFATLLPATVADAAPEGTLDRMTMDLSADGIYVGVYVDSADGESWTHIRDTGIQLAGPLEIKMKHGLIKAFAVFLGTCEGHACFETFGTPFLGSAIFGETSPKSIDGTVSFSFPSGLLGGSNSGGIPLVPYGNEIIARCNAGLEEGKSLQNGFGFMHTVEMTLGADTKMWDGFSFNSSGNGFALGSEPLADVDFSRTFDVALSVTCEAVPGAGGPEEISQDLPPYQVVGAALQGAPSVHEGACPVDLELSMSVESNIPGPFEARIEAKSGWKSEKLASQTSEAGANGSWAKHFTANLAIPVERPPEEPSGGAGMDAAAGIGQLGTVEPAPDDTFPGSGGIPDGPGEVQTGYNPRNLHEDSLRLVATGGGKTVISEWWKYSVTCDPQVGPSVGDLPQSLGQPAFIEQAFLTTFPKAPMDGSQCGMTVVGWIQTNVKNVPVKFRLRNHQGVTTPWQTILTSHANNIGKFLENLDFSTSGEGVWVSEEGGWALPGTGAGSQAGRKAGTLQIVIEQPVAFQSNVASYDFVCQDPAPTAIGTAPTVNLNPDVVPSDDLAGRKPPSTAVDIRWVQQRLLDLGYREVGGIDGAFGRRTRAALLAFKADNGLPPKPEVDDETVAALRTATPRKIPERQGDTAAPKRAIVDPVPKNVACAGGIVRNGMCACPEGTRAEEVRTNAYRCIREVARPEIKGIVVQPPVRKVEPQRVAPEIACRGGVVRNGACLCPQGSALRNGACRIGTAAREAPRRVAPPEAPLRLAPATRTP
ncbi:peptidoglycan-binding domain-containing protein [Chelativorans alearense]|uniref:peptidoglycan-binding domain-containing protein n=1 Tax=Chelativorans alearense TaxID=2681495 RepID=UPI0013D1DCF7|nr:peptidoglycan-binding domain-containing protein [Chelativorans alearense]